jgi:hypothetical protein
MCCLSFFVCNISFAMWAALSDDELILSSDLIVMGEWQGQTAVSAASIPEMTMAVIAISEVWKGAGDPVFALIALPSGKIPRSSSDLVFRRGDRGLWLLRLRPGGQGLYLVDHPQRFVPAASGDARIRQLRQLVKP